MHFYFFFHRTEFILKSRCLADLFISVFHPEISVFEKELFDLFFSVPLFNKQIETMTKANETQASWNDAQRKVFIKCIREQVELGKIGDNGLKKEAWSAILGNFNKKTALNYTKGQLHTQVSTSCF